MKSDSKLFDDWLVKQYRGESTAAARILAFIDRFVIDDDVKARLALIAEQERRHAMWIKALLRKREIEPSVTDAETRYWRETLPAIDSFNTGAAVAAHAEAMRLERIHTIVDDVTAPVDVREVFKLILIDEIEHERTFRDLAGQHALDMTANSHERGRAALGLEV